MNMFVRDGAVGRKRRRRYRFELNECHCPKPKKAKTDDWTPLSDAGTPADNNNVSPLCEAVEPPADDDDDDDDVVVPVPVPTEADDVAEPLACDRVSGSDLGHHSERQDCGPDERIAVIAKSKKPKKQLNKDYLLAKKYVYKDYKKIPYTHVNKDFKEYLNKFDIKKQKQVLRRILKVCYRKTHGCIIQCKKMMQQIEFNVLVKNEKLSLQNGFTGSKLLVYKDGEEKMNTCYGNTDIEQIINNRFIELFGLDFLESDNIILKEVSVLSTSESPNVTNETTEDGNYVQLSENNLNVSFFKTSLEIKDLANSLKNSLNQEVIPLKKKIDKVLIIKKIRDVVNVESAIYSNIIIKKLGMYFSYRDFLRNADSYWMSNESKHIQKFIVELIEMFDNMDCNIAYLTGCLVCVFRIVVDICPILPHEIKSKFIIFINLIKKYIKHYNCTLWRTWIISNMFFDWCFVIDSIFIDKDNDLEESQVLIANKYLKKVKHEKYKCFNNENKIPKTVQRGIFEFSNRDDDINYGGDVQHKKPESPNVSNELPISSNSVGLSNDETDMFNEAPKLKKQKLSEDCEETINKVKHYIRVCSEFSLSNSFKNNAHFPSEEVFDNTINVLKNNNVDCFRPNQINFKMVTEKAINNFNLPEIVEKRIKNNTLQLVTTTPSITTPVITVSVIITPVVAKTITTTSSITTSVTTTPVTNTPSITTPVITMSVTTTQVDTKPFTTLSVNITPVVAKTITTTSSISTSFTTPVTIMPVANTPVTNKPVANTPVTNKPVTITPVTITLVPTTPVTTIPVTTMSVTTTPVMPRAYFTIGDNPQKFDIDASLSGTSSQCYNNIDTISNSFYTQKHPVTVSTSSSQFTLNGLINSSSANIQKPSNIGRTMSNESVKLGPHNMFANASNHSVTTGCYTMPTNLYSNLKQQLLNTSCSVPNPFVSAGLYNASANIQSNKSVITGPYKMSCNAQHFPNHMKTLTNQSFATSLSNISKSLPPYTSVTNASCNYVSDYINSSNTGYFPVTTSTSTNQFVTNGLYKNSSVSSMKRIPTSTSIPSNWTTVSIPSNWPGTSIPSNWPATCIPSNWSATSIPSNWSTTTTPSTWSATSALSNWFASNLPSHLSTTNGYYKVTQDNILPKNYCGGSTYQPNFTENFINTTPINGIESISSYQSNTQFAKPNTNTLPSNCPQLPSYNNSSFDNQCSNFCNQTTCPMYNNMSQTLFSNTAASKSVLATGTLPNKTYKSNAPCTVSATNQIPTINTSMRNNYQLPNYSSQVSPDLPNAHSPNTPNQSNFIDVSNKQKKCMAVNCYNYMERTTTNLRSVTCCSCGYYCSIQCQNSDWHYHKNECHKIHISNNK